MCNPLSNSIRVVGFSRDILWWVAESRGFFAAHDLNVSFTEITSSKEEITGIITGRWDVAFDNADNVVAWDEGHGADGISHDLIIFMGGSQDLGHCLYASCDVGDIRDFRGKTLGVDAAATGYAIILRHILQCHGLSYGIDYSLKAVGSTPIRLKQLLEGTIAGAMLDPNYVDEGAGGKVHLLVRARDYISPYAARVGVVTRTWASSHRDLLVRFTRACILASEWIAAPRNRYEVIAIIEEKIRRRGSKAEEYYNELIKRDTGSYIGPALGTEALMRVVELRVNSGLMPPPVPPVEKYYDASFYEEAVLQLQERNLQ